MSHLSRWPAHHDGALLGSMVGPLRKSPEVQNQRHWKKRPGGPAAAEVSRTYWFTGVFWARPTGPTTFHESYKNLADSFVAQRFHGIDAQGAPRGDEARAQG